MEMNLCELECDLHLPPRKRLLNGFKKLNGSSSSSSTSNGSSSASTDVQTHLDNLLASPYNNDQTQSPEELVEATRSAAALAVKAAKEARAMANEKALISAKAIAAAKRALELVDSFPKEAYPKKNKQKKLELLYSKELRDKEEDLARRLHRAIDKTSSSLLTLGVNGQRYKKQKLNKEGESSSIRVTRSMNEIAGVVDSSSPCKELEEADSRTLMKEKGEEESKRRGRVKLKRIPLSICNSRDEENGASSTFVVAQPHEDGVVSSWKCVKQNKAVRS